MECLICQENIKNKFVILNCNCKNVFHNNCIKIWFKNKKSCPTCRKIWNKNVWQSDIEKLKLIKMRLNMEFHGILFHIT